MTGQLDRVKPIHVNADKATTKRYVLLLIVAFILLMGRSVFCLYMHTSTYECLVMNRDVCI